MSGFDSLYQSNHYQPQFPQDRTQLGIGIVGFGRAVRKWHLPAYKKYGLKVVGVYDVSPQVISQIREEYGYLHVFSSLDELLYHSDVQVVDIATRPTGRIELMYKVLEAGKHILAQKPLALDISQVYWFIGEAEKRGLKVAVNQNGRWAPPWRYATLLIKDGVIGNVQAVTHLYDTQMMWVPNIALHGSVHFLIYDYSIHWIDITRCWLEDKKITKVQAKDYLSSKKLEDGKITQSMWLAMDYDDDTSAMIRGVACAHAHTGHPFWIHGTEGTIRGSVDDKNGDYIVLEKKAVSSCYQLEGNWFPDGFAGSMGELMCAIVENREPYNSIQHNLLSLEMTLAACQSAEEGGSPITITP